MKNVDDKVNVLKEQGELAVKGFPNSYRHTINNRHCSVDDIQTKIDDAISFLIRTGEKQIMIHSGNTMVIVDDVHEEDGGGFHVIVSENYKEMYIGNKVLG